MLKKTITKFKREIVGLIRKVEASGYLIGTKNKKGAENPKKTFGKRELPSH